MKVRFLQNVSLLFLYCKSSSDNAEKYIINMIDEQYFIKIMFFFVHLAHSCLHGNHAKIRGRVRDHTGQRSPFHNKLVLVNYYWTDDGCQRLISRNPNRSMWLLLLLMVVLFSGETVMNDTRTRENILSKHK